MNIRSEIDGATAPARFYRGEIYESLSAGAACRAMVIELFEEGRRARLRPFGGGSDFSGSIVELVESRIWRKVSADD